MQSSDVLKPSSPVSNTSTSNTENDSSISSADLTGSEDDDRISLDDNELHSESSKDEESPLPWWWNQDDIVISGISAKFPESDSIAEFEYNLMNSIDCVTEDDRRWDPGFYGLPRRCGKLKELKKFDASAFGVHPKQAHVMDPQLRMLLEEVYEAIVDSGTNPADLRGKKVGVYVGACGSETESYLTGSLETTSGYVLIGCQRSMFANRISYCYDFRGPSFPVDTACSSSLIAFHVAVNEIRSGHCDAAIVAGTSLNLCAGFSVPFFQIGMTGTDGTCRSFDAEGKGYVRAEGVGCVLLQRSSVAHRCYATVLNAGSNADGYKQEGVTFPLGERQAALLRSVYQQAKINPADVSFLECHGTGTPAGDPQECIGVTDVFCRNRDTPLLIGSVKSNMGHAEPASGISSLAKVIIAMERNVIPPNLHYTKPNPYIPALLDGRLQVVTKPTPWNGGIVGINSFGFGGANAHCVLKSNPRDREPQSPLSIPKLFCYNGRTVEGVNHMLKLVEDNRTDQDLFALLTETANVPIGMMLYRGFTIIPVDPAVEPIRNVKKCVDIDEKRPVWWVYSGMGTQWPSMARQMMSFETFRNSIDRCCEVLKPLGLNLRHLLLEDESEDIYNNVLYSFVANTAMQIALTDVLKKVDVHHDGMLGHSAGEIACAYADGCFSLEETLLSAYWRGKCILDEGLEAGAMAVVGLTWEEAQSRCPPGIVPACHNAEDSVTISGPVKEVADFVQKLKDEDVFAKEVKSAGVAFHSYFMTKVASALEKNLRQVIKGKRPRSSLWISTSVPAKDWSSKLARYSSPAYFVNNLTAPVLFYEAAQYIPENAIVIEVASHCLLQAVLKRTVSPQCFTIGIMKANHENNLNYFLNSLGSCYQNGMWLKMTSLYGQVKWPVSRGTPMLNSEIKWDHSVDWKTLTKEEGMGWLAGGNGITYTQDPFNPEKQDQFLLDHKIDGRPLYPFTGYLVLVWQALCKIKNVDYLKTPIVMQDIRVVRATPLTGPVKFEVTITPGTGYFEVVESGGLVASGRIQLAEDVSAYTLDSGTPLSTLLPENCCDGVELDSKDTYKEYFLKGYDYGPEFRGILKTCTRGHRFQLKWKDNYITFLDSLVHSSFMQLRNYDLRLLTRILYVLIDPVKHLEAVQNFDDETKCIPAYHNLKTDTFSAGGIKVRCLGTQMVSRRLNQPAKAELEYSTFVPYKDNKTFADYKDLYTKLKTYENVCCSIAQSVAKKLGKSSKKSPNKAQFQWLTKHTSARTLDEKELDQFALQGEPNLNKRYSLLKLLLQLNNMPDDVLPDQLAESIQKADLSSDFYNTITYHGRITHHLLGLYLSQFAPHFNKNIELESANENRYALRCKHLCERSPLIEQIWDVLVSEDQEVEALEQLGGEKLVFDLSSDAPLPESLSGHHLAVMEHVLSAKADPVYYLKRVQELLVDEGMVLITEVTENFELAYLTSGRQKNSSADPNRICGLYYKHEQWCKIFEESGFNLIAWQRPDLTCSSYLLRKPLPEPIEPCFINADDVTEFNWIPKVQLELEGRLNEPANKSVWLVSETTPDNGLEAFVHCVREESAKVHRLRHLSNASFDNSKVTLNIENSEVQERLKHNLQSNIYRNGVWGASTHVELTDEEIYTHVDTEYAFMNTLTRGNLSSFAWIQNNNEYWQITPDRKPGQELCYVYYAGLNFRDVMLATGRLHTDAVPKDHINRFLDGDGLLGIEFAGRLRNGRRIMGMIGCQALSTTVIVEPEVCWSYPDHWTMAEAATVPSVYLTAYYALCFRGHMHSGQKVLIHAGTGGVGQAAIRIAQSMNCEVFTTVSTEAKRKFIRDTFGLDDGHIFNSRTTEFEEDIFNATQGYGVDLALNSLSNEHLHATIRCLAQNGQFLEIGKVDIQQDTPIGMAHLGKNASVHGLLLGALHNISQRREWYRLTDLMQRGILSGVVQPLPINVFDDHQVEDAFRFLASGQHIGKVVIKIREEEPEKVVIPKPRTVQAVAKVICHPRHVYLITGGLGGFGLELAQWLVDRGAKNVVLTSRSGVKTGYQKRLIYFWNKRNIRVDVVSYDVAEKDATKKLLEFCQTVGPIGGIFHLAMVLRDGLFENQEVKNFKESSAAKYWGTRHLDELSRDMCDETLKWFVVFSSIASGRGNEGQSNYGWSNCTMERIVEKRHHDGLPGLAIQWGAVGDVGVVMDSTGDNMTAIGGTLPQRMPSCLHALNVFLTRTNWPIVSSYVRAETKHKYSGGRTDLLQAVANILGADDASSLDLDAKLTDLGLDSLMGVELRQMLEREYDMVLPMKSIRTLTLRKLKDIIDGGGDFSSLQTDDEMADNSGEKSLLEYFGVRVNMNDLPPLVPVKKINEATSGQPLFIVHSIEGIADNLEPLAAHISSPVYAFQCTPDVPYTTVEGMAQTYLQEMKKIQPHGPYNLAGYSYGSCIAYEMAHTLQTESNDGYIDNNLIMLDLTHMYWQTYKQIYQDAYKIVGTDNIVFETEFLIQLSMRFVKFDIPAETAALYKMKTIDERFERMVQVIMSAEDCPFKTAETCNYVLRMVVWRYKAADKWIQQDKSKLALDVTLIKSKLQSQANNSEDYGLSKVVEGSISVHTVEGDHDTFIRDDSAKETATIINNVLMAEKY